MILLKTVLIIGAGRSGMAAFNLLSQHNVKAVLFDDHKPYQPTIIMDDISAVILSPGIERSHPLVVKACELNIPILNEMDLAFRFLPPAKIIGITGTNGKSTTTKMLESMLQCAGFKAIACGNLGLPLCEIAILKETFDHLVVEISSFQLETLSWLKLDRALILNITPDHLDRYRSFADYKKAKLKIVNLLKPEGQLFINRDLAPVNFPNTLSFSLNNSGASIAKDILGTHNQENAWGAALVARSLSLNDEQITLGLKNFTPLPHRCEYVGEYQGVRYINDSKGTTVVAVMKALEMCKGPVHLMLGGIEKGEDFFALNHNNFPQIAGYYIYGQAQEKIARELGVDHTYPDLKSAVLAAKNQAQAGDTILLSPGCASYDQFDNYHHRGEVFKQIFEQQSAAEGPKCT